MRIPSPRSFWRRAGNIAAYQRLSLSQALTHRDAKVDAWITQGFNSSTRKINRREREALGSADDFALVKSKIGI